MSAIASFTVTHLKCPMEMTPKQPMLFEFSPATVPYPTPTINHQLLPPPGDGERTQFVRWLTLAGPTQSVSINMQVLEDAAWAAYERTQEFWLWVDALCVMSDDEDNVFWHLEHRSQIFGDADCCIVLLAGLGRHASLEERTGFFSMYRTLLDVVRPNPEDVVVLHSWPNKYGSGQWYLPQPDVMMDGVHHLKM